MSNCIKKSFPGASIFSSFHPETQVQLQHERIRSLEIPCRKLKEEVGENTESFERQESAANVSCHPCEKDGKLLKNQKVACPQIINTIKPTPK
jgi:hypothetical protein